ncbi:VOC family protein [Sphingomonas jatrophae]|uniref:Glyoxalase/Bleomycin resistance protein/Dioxygenase superfamily protein n=1 Tax=Sphingomonas jatrophae TaxID=1166337 RepID=A0A1I6KJN6_9SPHN|nr:VOC family protein [Sphingomonas jatrophae]SFR91455.1 Glyoxalase/Bleomycin resistance protein/Dioxygenase superfamily protein [Sphingomonas jatrophae]
MFGPIDQIGHVVEDLDAAVAARLALGIGPWTVFRGTTLHGRHRGEETIVTIDVALGYQGSVQVELIQEMTGTPSPYAGARGPHHLAWLVDDLDAAVAQASARGLVPVFEAGNAAVRVAYLEHPADPGSYYELIEGEGMRAMVDAGIVAAATWDGSDPIHEIDMRGPAA